MQAAPSPLSPSPRFSSNEGHGSCQGGTRGSKCAPPLAAREGLTGGRRRAGTRLTSQGLSGREVSETRE